MTLMEPQQDLIGLGQGQASPDKVARNQDNLDQRQLALVKIWSETTCPIL